MDLELYHSFGLHCDIIHNVTFYNEITLIFVAGKLSILLDLNTHQQKVIQIAEGREITALAKYPEQLALAIKGRPPSVVLLNLTSDTKQVYEAPERMKSDEFLCISMSATHKFVAAQGNSPDWKLVIWLANEKQVVAIFNPTSKRIGSAVREISFHAGGREEVVAVGKNVFKLYECQVGEDKGNVTFSEIVFEKFEVGEEYCAIAWPQKETLSVSTRGGRVLFFRGIDLVFTMEVSNDVREASKKGAVGFDIEDRTYPTVTCLACTSSEILCSFSGSIVAVYKGGEVSQYVLNRLIFLPDQKHKDPLPGEQKIERDIITLMELSPSNGLVIVSTAHGQLLYSDLFEEGEFCRYFVPLLQRQHANSILAMDVARGRPLVATCSKRCAILWNYRTKNQEMFSIFKDKMTCLAIHPSGYYLVLGFVLYTRICTVLYNGLKDRQILEPKNCSKVCFSYGGHMLVLASETVIDVYDFMTFDKLARLEGHAGLISSVAWKDDDTRIVSCDVLGVICEWDVRTWCKVWENTSIESYSSLAVLPNRNSVIAATVGKGLKCLADGFVQWEFSCSNELSAIAASTDGETLYSGGKDGTLGRYALPAEEFSSDMHAHGETVTHLMFCAEFRVLFTVSLDGLLFGWKYVREEIPEVVPDTDLSNSVLIRTTDLKKQDERENLLRLSIKQCKISYECDLKLNRMNHVESKRKIFVNHESAVKNINEEIGNLKEKVQDMLFETDIPSDLKKLEDVHRKKTIQHVEKLAEAYSNTGCYLEETREITKKLEDALKSSEKDYAEVSSDLQACENEIIDTIKDLESRISEEKKATEIQRNSLEEGKKRILEEEAAKQNRLKESGRLKLETERHKSEQMEEELMRLRNLKLFVDKENKRKHSIACGEIDHDIDGKLKSIEVLEQRLHGLEEKLKAKDKIAQTQDVTFFEKRKLIGDLQRAHFISKNKIKDLRTALESTERSIDKCQAEIKETTQSIPSLQEETRLVKEQCSSLGLKLKETSDGYGDKRSLLRHNQSLVSKYESLLNQSHSQTSDPEELKKEILDIFSQIKKGTDESLDEDLKNEFAHQIETLQGIYKDIVGDPNNATKELSLAELKLSQENSKLLKQVHEIQEERDQLRDLVFEMEVAMGMPFTRQAKITKEVNELRDKIELVVGKDKGEDRNLKMARLDELIKEQQDEIERLQLSLSEKSLKK